MSFVNVEYPHDGVCQITLNRPERMNAMAFDVMVPFREALEAASFNNDVRVVIVTGAGEGFCAGQIWKTRVGWIFSMA
ncbi:enoyl-CoA hydratase-related protein [Halioglobus japonicus]|uniref:enoyl-CoA hydratase-related protein n=1 Tax=Halioglobus japonicus TaxID=930805 RepID=UPI00197AAB8C|nr:enoyl-CoA hydratase-related protein [Halioglobus japonicus]